MYLPLIAAALSLIEAIVPQIARWRELAQQNKELTPEQETALDERMAEVMSGKPWQL